MINDKGPYRFMVDTGASISVISQNLVNTLKLQQIKRVNFTRNNAHLKADLYRIPKLKLGVAELYNYDVIVYPEPTFISFLKKEFNENIDGILGIGAFYDYLLTLDFPHKLLFLENNRLQPKSKNVLSFNNQEKIPIVSVSFKDKSNMAKQINFVIDTGSNEQFTLSPVIGTLPFKKLQSQKIHHGTHYGEYHALKDKLDVNAYWGNKIFNNPTVVYNNEIFSKNDSFGLMGILVIDKLRLTIDQRYNLIKIE